MPDPTDEFDLPRKLTDALRAAYTHRAAIPAAVDQAVLGAVHDRLTRRRRLRNLARWGTGLAAGIAAAVVLAVTLHHPPAPARTIAQGDVNADGQLNIVDALALAKHLAAHDPTNPAWDLNHDGVIDQKDVDTLASNAVRLSPPGARLPKLDDLGLAKLRHVRFASANGTPAQTPTFSLSTPQHKEAQ